MKCKYCGKEFKKNTNIPDFIPENLKKIMEYIPDCQCADIASKKLESEKEIKRIRESVENKVKKFKDISIIDSKFELSKFENAEEDKIILLAKKYTKNLLDKGGRAGMLFHGSVGTGKTFAACCIANELMESNKTVLVMNLGLYLSKLKREWAEAENDVLNYVTTCDMLIIDDFGVEKSTEFVVEKVFTLIDARYRAKKPVIITTNLNLNDITAKFNNRIGDRLAEMCYPIEVIGESKRGLEIKDEFLKLMV